MKVMALLLRAKELIKMGTKGCTVVKPISAKTTMYMAAVIETTCMLATQRLGDLPNGMRQPNLSKKAPTAGVRTMGTTP